MGSLKYGPKEVALKFMLNYFVYAVVTKLFNLLLSLVFLINTNLGS